MSMDWARLMRGISSSAKVMTPWLASACITFLAGERIQLRDENRARFEIADLVEALGAGHRLLNFEDDVGGGGRGRRGRDGRAGLLIHGIADLGTGAGAGFNRDLTARG